MKLKLHHINLSSNNVKKMNEFYKQVLLLDTETNDLPILERKKGYSGEVEFVTDGNIQTHLAEKDLDVNFKTGHSINPLERGHIAYRTDDLDEFKKLSILTGERQQLQGGNRFFFMILMEIS